VLQSADRLPFRGSSVARPRTPGALLTPRSCSTAPPFSAVVPAERPPTIPKFARLIGSRTRAAAPLAARRNDDRRAGGPPRARSVQPVRPAGSGRATMGRYVTLGRSAPVPFLGRKPSIQAGNQTEFRETWARGVPASLSKMARGPPHARADNTRADRPGTRTGSATRGAGPAGLGAGDRNAKLQSRPESGSQRRS